MLVSACASMLVHRHVQHYGQISQCIFEIWQFGLLWRMMEIPKSEGFYSNTVSYSIKPLTFDGLLARDMFRDLGLNWLYALGEVHSNTRHENRKKTNKPTPQIQDGRHPVGFQVRFQDTFFFARLRMLHVSANFQICR